MKKQLLMLTMLVSGMNVYPMLRRSAPKAATRAGAFAPTATHRFRFVQTPKDPHDIALDRLKGVGPKLAEKIAPHRAFWSDSSRTIPDQLKSLKEQEFQTFVHHTDTLHDPTTDKIYRKITIASIDPADPENPAKFFTKDFYVQQRDIRGDRNKFTYVDKGLVSEDDEHPIVYHNPEKLKAHIQQNIERVEAERQAKIAAASQATHDAFNEPDEPVEY